MSTAVRRSTAERRPGIAGGVERSRLRIAVRGLVQGVGFRPFVHAAATALGLAGTVVNDSNGVLIEVEGDPAVLDEFQRILLADPPPLAIVEQVTVTGLAPEGRTGFSIGDSACSGTGRTLASPDVATCAQCLADLIDPTNRRYRHPFVSCTNCGPRFTIITALPYDRVCTTMAGFPMCPTCAKEYRDPTDRRFHAQPIACPECGPRLEFHDGSGGAGPTGHAVHGDDAAMAHARRRRRPGRQGSGRVPPGLRRP